MLQMVALPMIVSASDWGTRMKGALWIAAAAALLCGCTGRKPHDCNGDRILKCIQRLAAKSDRELILACMPLSEQQKISGTWVFGFELNEFYEGTPPSRDALAHHAGDTSLEPDPNVPNDGRYRTFRVVFVGRRELCDGGVPRHTILIDRMLSSKLVAAAD